MGPASASGGRWHTDRPPRFFIAGYNHADLLPQRHHSEHTGDRRAMRFFRCQLLHPHLPEDPRFYADRISEISAKTRKKSMNDGSEPPEGLGQDIVHGLQNALSKRQSPFVYRQVDSAFFFFACRYKNRFPFCGTRGKWILPCFPFFSVTLSAPACSAPHAIFSFLSPIFR